MITSTDVNFCLGEFTRLFKSAIDKVAPFRDIRVKVRSEPWMNAHISAGIKEWDRLFQRYKKDKGNLPLYKEFCKLRNSVQRDIRFAKTAFFRGKIEQNRGDSGKLWGQLKSLGYSGKGSDDSSTIVLEEDGKKVFDSKDVAGIFNNFYTTVASKLVEKLPPAPGFFNIASTAFREFYRKRLPFGTTFTLSPVTHLFILGQLLSLNPNKAIGLDDIASRFLRDGASVIVEPFSHIVNISIITETVPVAFKQARVIPLFKKGSKLDVGIIVLLVSCVYFLRSWNVLSTDS